MNIIDDGASGGGGSNLDSVFVDVYWTFNEPPPTGLLIGFEVVLYTGTNPADTTTYLAPIISVHPTDRRLLTDVSYAKGAAPASINAAVRTVYPEGRSAWGVAGVSASVTLTDTQNVSNDNLIPNPTSEAGTSIKGYASALVVNDAGNSYAGNYCRKLDASATNQTALTPKIPCVYGDQFSFDGYVKGSNGTVAAQLVLKFYNSAGSVVGTTTSSAFASSTYQTMAPFRGAAPASAVSVQAFVQASTTGASQFLYFDNLSLRRSVKFDHMETDGGFRGKNAIKNLLGTGTTSDRAFYAGNVDPGTKGGAPNIATLTVTRDHWDTTNKNAKLTLTAQPTQPSDNLDGMRSATVQWYRQSALPTAYSGVKSMTINATAKTITRNDGGSFITDGFAAVVTATSGFTNSANNQTNLWTVSSVTASVLTFSTMTGAVNEGPTLTAAVSQGAASMTLVSSVPSFISDRLYANTTDSNAANAAKGASVLAHSGISSGYPACKVTLNNAFGPSDTYCYFSDASAADGVNLISIGTVFPPSLTGGGSGVSGGGGGGGGSCPAPWVLVDVLVDGAEAQKRAGDLQVGDLVMTYHAATRTRGAWPVRAVSTDPEAERWDLTMEDGLTLTFAKNHRFFMADGRLIAVQDLEPGDLIDGDTPRKVASVTLRDTGPVVAISVDGAFTYQTSGLLQSNLKP